MINFSKIKESFTGKRDYPEEFTDDYVELDTEVDRKIKAKISVRPFVIEDFSDIKPALDALREGYTIALLNIRPLKDRDLVELKRAISKIKKTCEVIDGDIAGFGDDWIVATPGFAKVHRETKGAEEYSEA